MKGEYTLQVANPRAGIRHAHIYATRVMGKLQYTLAVVRNIGGHIVSFSEAYRTEVGARIAYTLKFQQAAFHSKPEWERADG